MTKPLRVAFYVRNRFQVLHLRPIFRAVEGAVWVVAARKDVDGFGITSERHEVVRFFLRRRLEQFDAVVSHAGPPRGKPLVRAKFIMVQYGYAKEPYNFGVWRKTADAICAYGSYAVVRFEPHAPAYAIGNPRWDDFSAEGFAATAKAALPALNPDKPVVIYAPTWGDLSSLPQWSNVLSDLASNYTVLVKAHHNSLRDGQLDFVASHEDLHNVSDVDLMQAIAVSDVMVSDYSGAIFDAIMCDKPVVLLDVEGIETQYGAKLDVTSIEMAQRDALGFRVTQADEISGAIERAIAEGPRVSDALKAALFVTPPSVGDAFVAALGVIMARP